MYRDCPAMDLTVAEDLYRRLINGQLGYRNFNEFLNSYRINEARDRLSDAEFSKMTRP